MESDNVLRATRPHESLNPLVVLENLVDLRLDINRLDYLVLDLTDY